MNYFPKSFDGWRKVFFFIFRAYVLLAFATVQLFHNLNQARNLRAYMTGTVSYILLGYLACFLVFLLGSIPFFNHVARERIINLVFLLLTVLLGIYLYETSAKVLKLGM